MSTEGWVAVGTLTLAMVAGVFGIAGKALAMLIDSRVRKQLDPAVSTIQLAVSAMSLNLETTSVALGRLSAKIDNGLDRRLKNLETDVRALVSALLAGR